MIGTKPQVIEYLNTLPNDDTKYEIDKYREKRSKDANSLFHVLADKLRVALNTSPAYMKNLLVSKYGVMLYADDGQRLVYKTNASPEFMLEIADPHFWLIQTEEQNGKTIYWYQIFKRTREYNSKEMSHLISGTIEDCKEQGIDTANPNEVKRLLDMWEKRYG